MKKVLKIVAVVLFAFFVAIQFVRPNRKKTAIVQAETIELANEIPEDARSIFERSCSDCHTNATAYPWYSNVTPFNWLLANHIREGRGELNFSVWNTYEPRRKRRKLDQICEQITDGEMPLPSYLWIHQTAKLSSDEVKILCDWTEFEKARRAGNQ